MGVYYVFIPIGSLRIEENQNLMQLTERERYDWLIWECGRRGVGIQWDRMALPSHKWFDIYHTYNEETKGIVVPQTIEECDEEFVNILKSSNSIEGI
jgi:hypothetical protein